MIKQFIFVILATFGFSSAAGMHSGMNHMSDMAGDGGFAGSVRVKYHVLGGHDGHPLNHRTTLGWAGDVNEAIKWGVSVRADDAPFSTLGLGDSVHLHQAYVHWMPVDGLSVAAGKKNWHVNFHKAGVVWEDDLQPEGVFIKYRHNLGGDHAKVYAKLAVFELDDEHTGPLTAGTTIKGKLGGHFMLSDGIMGGVHVGAMHDGLFKDETATAKTLVHVGVNVSASEMAVPVGLFGAYFANTENLGDNHSFSGGVYVGNAGSEHHGEMGDFGVAVNYYDINENSFNTDLLNTEYVTAGGSHKGVAVRAQYNVWNNTNVVAQFAHNLDGGDNANNLVGVLNFNF